LQHLRWEQKAEAAKTGLLMALVQVDPEAPHQVVWVQQSTAAAQVVVVAARRSRAAQVERLVRTGQALLAQRAGQEGLVTLVLAVRAAPRG
jgi:hypothetical protein